MTSKQRNIVDPLGNIHSTPDFKRSLMGNRGQLENDRLTGPPKKYHANNSWIYCRYQGVSQPTKPPLYTALFFLDEATALAAGHRPCYQCSKPLYEAFKSLWPHAENSAKAIDRILHQERFTHKGKGDLGKKIIHPNQPLNQLPVGAFVLRGNEPTPFVVVEDALYPWTLTGYGAPIKRPEREQVALLTPPSAVKVLQAGYRPQIYLTGQEPYFDEGRWRSI